MAAAITLNKSYKTSGFSLIELIITIAIVAVLATIALPSYRNVLAKSDRTTAISVVGDISLSLERYYSANRFYTNDFGDLNMSAAGSMSLSDSKDHYHYTVTLPDNQTYIISATPNHSRDLWTLFQDNFGVQTFCQNCSHADALLGWP